jgi:MFS family permease
MTYTASALLGATYIVKRAGARNALWLGMAMYCVYVGCFYLATRFDDIDSQRFYAYTGAAIGGVGAGFLWTAQGAYFAQAAEEHALLLGAPVSTSTASFAGIFAFLYLAEEVLLRLLSTVLVGFASWEVIFAVYTAVTLISTSAMPLVRNYHPTNSSNNEDNHQQSGIPTTSVFYKVTAAAQLLYKDPKMKYMIGLNAVFGFAAAFLNSYVNGQVVPVALNDPDSKYIGILSSWVSAVAAGMSLIFGRLAPTIGRGPILMLGAACFLGVVLPFVVQPNAEQYGWGLLVLVYTLHGTGRATFEGTLKATFADYFAYEKEGAFANIILQNGLSGAIGYICKCPTVVPSMRASPFDVTFHHPIPPF